MYRYMYWSTWYFHIQLFRHSNLVSLTRVFSQYLVYTIIHIYTSWIKSVYNWCLLFMYFCCSLHSEEFKCISLYIYMYFFLSELPVLYGPNVFCKICSTKVHVKLFKRNGFIEKLLHLFTYSRSRIIIISFLVCKNWELLPFSYINSGNQQSCCPYF